MEAIIVASARAEKGGRPGAEILVEEERTPLRALTSIWRSLNSRRGRSRTPLLEGGDREKKVKK